MVIWGLQFSRDTQTNNGSAEEPTQAIRVRHSEQCPILVKRKRDDCLPPVHAVGLIFASFSFNRSAKHVP